jgi:uncharacterized protein
MRGETRLALRVTPGAKRNAVKALKDGIWQLKIAAPAVEGKANAELISYLSEILGVRKSCFHFLKGESSHSKLLSVEDISLEALASRLSCELGK